MKLYSAAIEHNLAGGADWADGVKGTRINESIKKIEK